MSEGNPPVAGLYSRKTITAPIIQGVRGESELKKSTSLLPGRACHIDVYVHVCSVRLIK